MLKHIPKETHFTLLQRSREQQNLVSNDTISSSGVKRNSHLSEKSQTHKAVELPVLLPVSSLVRLALTLPMGQKKNKFSVVQTVETPFTKDTEKKSRFHIYDISRSSKRGRETFTGEFFKYYSYALNLSTQNGKL